MKKFLITALVFIILVASGVCLAFFTDIFTGTICYVLGGVAIAIAIIKFIDAYRKNTIKDIALCLLLFIVGLLLIILKNEVLYVLPIIVGTCFIVYEVVKIIKNFKLKDTDSTAFKMILIASLIGIVFCLAVMCFINFETIALKLIGALLIFYSIQYVFSAIVLSKAINASGKDDEKEAKKASKKDKEENEEEGQGICPVLSFYFLL